MELWTVSFPLQVKRRGVKNRRASIFLIRVLTIARRNSLVSSVGVGSIFTRSFFAAFFERMLRLLRFHGHSCDR